MDSIFSAIVLAVVQGIAEWLPISSSGHLVLFSKILNFDNNIQFDVALHFGTLMAIFVYFGKDILDILEDILKGKWKSPNAKLGFLIAVATIPAAILGYLLGPFLERVFDNLYLLALGLGVTSLVLFIGSFAEKSKNSKLTLKKSILIGLAQCASLFRGISRSGSTISTGLLLGLDEKTAVKFSFLLSIPIILGANILLMGNETLPPNYLFASLISFGIGLATIHVSFKYILSSRENLRWIGLYVLLLSLTLAGYLLFF